MRTSGAGTAGRAARVARAAAALAALAFAGAVALQPSSDERPRAADLAVGDPYDGGRIVDLRWTGDHSRRVAVTKRGESRAAVAVAPNGARQIVAAHVVGGLDVYPAPTGSRIAIVRTRKNQRARIAVLDVNARRETWWRWANGPATVRWEPETETLSISDADACNVVSAYDGQLLYASCNPKS